MRKSFRVATAFTGAAAAAAAFAPAAQAAPVATGAAARVTPDITGGNCDVPQVVNSVVLYYAASQKHPVPACFAGTGWWYLGTGKRFASYCAGEYSGSFEIGGTFRHFTAGRHNLYGASVEGVYISKNRNQPTSICSTGQVM